MILNYFYWGGFRRKRSYYEIIFFLFILLAGTSAKLCAQGVKSLEMQVAVASSKNLNDYFTEIEKQTGYRFVYSKEDVNPEKLINPPAGKDKLSNILKAVLWPLGLTFHVSNNYISISLNKSNTTTGAIQTDADKETPILITVTGIISDLNKEPIIGASIREEGTKNGSISDINGMFRLSVSPTAKLRITYIGYEPKTLLVTGKTSFRITLNQDMKMLDEVILVAYGIQKRINLTGAVSVVSSEKIIRTHRPDITGALAGTASGVRAVQKSGRPGADGSEIDIRGYGIPLTVVDGVERPFSQIDPNEIESITVLKDASASVYGFKGANGVLLVTTRKGGENKTQVNYNFNYGIQKITDYPRYMNGVEYATYVDEALMNMNEAPRFGKERIDRIAAGTDPDYVNTDWNKALLKESAPIRQHNLNLSGGNQTTGYFISLGYLHQDGIIKTKDNYQRYNLRSNINTVIAKKLTAELQIGGRSERNDAPGNFENQGGEDTDKFSFNIFKALGMAIPLYKIYANDNPKYYQYITGSSKNPLAAVDREVVGTNYRQYDEFNGLFSLSYDIPYVKGLSAKALLAYDRQWLRGKKYSKAWSLYNYEERTATYKEEIQRSITELTERREENTAFNRQYSLNYKKIAGKHTMAGMILLEAKQYEHIELQLSGEMEVNGLPEIGAAKDGTLKKQGSSYETAYMGIVGRLNYGYAEKYLLEFSFREDGSYKFEKKKRWGFFPAVSMGWRISEEAFIRDNTDVFDNLKLRASYGKVGDDSAADATTFIAGYLYPGIFSNFVMGTGNAVIGASNKGLTNSYLTWYKVTMINMGLDASILDGRLHAEIDWFYRKRTGILAHRNVSLPSTFGAVFTQENLNSDDNRGFEFALGTKQKWGDFYIDIKGTFSYSRARYLYQEQSEAGNDYDYWRGPERSDLKSPYRWTNVSWGYTALGQFKSYEEILNSPIQDGLGNVTLMPGDIKYEDLNNDGKIDRLDDSPIGRNGTPDTFFGLNVSVNWKRFDFTMFWQGATDYTYPFNYRQPFLQNSMGNGYKMFADRWHRVDNADQNSDWIPGRFPALRIANFENNERNSTFWNINATYLRLKTIDLGYTLPKTVSQRAGIQRVRFYVNAYNILTFKNKNMKGVDPEGESGYGLFYPQMKTFNFGINVTF